MKKLKRRWMVAAMLASLSGVTLAEGGGFYGAIDLGQGQLKDACAETVSNETCSDTDMAFRGALGYQLHPNVAVEASYASYGTSKYNDNAGGFTGKAEVTGFLLSAIGSYPLSDAFSLTGKLGAALLTGEVTVAFSGVSVMFDDNSTTLAWGIGVRYNISPSVALRAQYEALGEASFGGGAVSDVNLLSAGLIFSF